MVSSGTNLLSMVALAHNL